MGIDAEMFVRTRSKLSNVAIKTAMWDTCAVFGANKFWAPLHRVWVYEQDGPDIKPEEGEAFIRVMPVTRYYGVGYERGDILFLINLAEWLELRFAPCEVWYGGDSMGICAEHFTKAERGKIKAHFFRVAHEPYVHDLDLIFDNCLPPKCERCVPHRGPGRFSSGPSSFASFHCTGCGKSFVTLDGGDTWGTGSNTDQALKDLQKQVSH